jgi:hypothetical protein
VVSTVNGKARPAPADLVFEAVDICRYAAGSSTPQHDLLSANHDFSYTARASASSGSVEVELPLGSYRVTAIPRGPGAALTVVNPFALAGAECNLVTPEAIELATQSIVTGAAVVADTRALAAATVELVPTRCADSEVDPACLPRGAQTVTSSSGAYSLTVDPGGYLLRVRPAVGSALPWVVQPLTVTAGSTPSASQTTIAPVTTVPAPLYAGLQLFDGLGNPAAGAIVRIYQNPTAGAPYEIGEALTDATGHFDMYLDPAAQ